VLASPAIFGPASCILTRLVNTEATGDYFVRPADLVADEHIILSLLRNASGTPGAVERKYQWFYEEPHLGPTLTLLLCHKSADHVVGMVTIGHRRLLVDNLPIDAGLLVDLHVESAHRTLGPALQLLREAISLGLARFSILYGYPNIRAQPLLRRAGFTIVAHAKRFARVIRFSEFLPKTVPRIIRLTLGGALDLVQWMRFGVSASAGPRPSAVVHEYCDAGLLPVPSFDSEALQAAPSVVIGKHTPEFLQWRFGQAALHPCMAATLSSPDPRYGSCFYILDGSSSMLQIRDTTALIHTTRSAKRFWQALISEARQRGYRSVSFVCTASDPLTAELAKLGFTIRDQHPVFAMCRSTHASLMQRCSWLLSDADEDE